MRLPLAVLAVVATIASLTSCSPSAPRECTPEEVAAVFGGTFDASEVNAVGAFELPNALNETTCAGQYELPLVQSSSVVFGGGTFSVAVVGGGLKFYDRLADTLTDEGFVASSDTGSFARWDKGQLELTALDLSNALSAGGPESLNENAGLHVVVVTTLTQ